jgi:mediator of replication checkpoint protein 1
VEESPASTINTNAQDAFAGLRAQGPIGLIPTDAMLPGVNISDTQAARDNALIAGEIEGAMQSQTLQSQKKEMYINEAG